MLLLKAKNHKIKKIRKNNKNYVNLISTQINKTLNTTPATTTTTTRTRTNTTRSRAASIQDELEVKVAAASRQRSSSRQQKSCKNSNCSLNRKRKSTTAAINNSYSSLRQRPMKSFLWMLLLQLLLAIALPASSSTHAAVLDITGANGNLTDLGMPAPKYQTAYACEGKKLTIECEPGDIINLIRANYGRFSITICNDHGNVDWSVNCMFPKSATVLNSRCAHKQSCSVLATTSIFGDPCPGTHKYLEAHYQCISASQTSTTTTNRPSPPWVLTGNGNTPPILANNSTFFNPIAGGVAGSATSAKPAPPRLPLPGVGPGIIPGSNSVLPALWNTIPSSAGPLAPPGVPPQLPTISPTLPGGRIKAGNNNANRAADGQIVASPPLPPIQPHNNRHHPHHHSGVTPTNFNNTTPPNTRILTGVGGTGSDDATLLTTKSTQQHFNGGRNIQTTTLPSELNGVGGNTRATNAINNANAVADSEEANMFCGPTNARNLFWNITRVGDVNVQPCPGGATGIAKWRCVLMKRVPNDSNMADELPMMDAAADSGGSSSTTKTPTNCSNGSLACDTRHLRGFEPTWHPTTPDLTQCRSLWLNNLEVRVNQRDSSLISIANDLSEVTSSKTLYGGDMLVTTKIIQTMSEKMFHDKETFPDQRQREAIILELLLGVVKTGSNLLDETQLHSWLDLNQEDQMRVATSLLTGLEYNAFLLADTIIRERNVVQKVKNILLAVRVLETKNIQSNVVFPDADQWQVSDDRIELPRAALLENSEGGLVRIVFAAFDRLESILKPTYDHFDLKSSRSYLRNTAILSNESQAADNSGSGSGGGNLQQRMRILNSKVISASLGKGRHIQLSQPIKLVLRHLKTENVTNPTCVFWNYIDHAWSVNGCDLESTNRTHSVCMCNHLTNFALLMDVLDENNHSLFTMFDGNMRVLIYISIGICLIFIVIALLTLKIFNGVIIKSARTSIYRSIYICILLTEILFLLGIEQSESSIFCGFTAVFIHCAILSAIAWFCFEAFQSYTTLTTDDMLLEVDQTAKVNCYYLLSYALSISIVAISLVINPSSYTRNDFCVLMESNALFYATFVTPVLLYFLGAVVYTCLASLLLCRKSRMALKNKEHTRLANVRFDIRCSFIFLLIMSAAWTCAYFYLRLAKADDDNASIFGYLFVSFNTIMGFFIFIFHCIQNEKIRREYRKYVRKNAWLPKCLRCSKTSISSGMGVAGNGGGGANANTTGNVGTGASNTVGSTSTHGGSSGQLKKSKIQLNDDNETADELMTTGVMINAAGDSDDAIIASSDCELNNEAAQTRRTIKGSSGIMPGTLAVVQQNNKNNAVAMAQSASGGTLRSQKGHTTPSLGHASPTSSVSSTHLIFGHGHKQQQQQQQPMPQHALALGGTHEAYYHQPGGVALPMQFHGNNLSPQGQPHEFFYWTQKHGSGNNPHGKKKRNSAMTAANGSDSPSGSLHSRATAASQIIFYPSYKKTSIKNQQQYPHYAEAVEPTTAFYQQQQQQRRYQSGGVGSAANAANYQHQHQHHHRQQQQQQYLSSDDEPPEAATAHAHLLHLSRRAAAAAAQQQQQQLSAYPPAHQYGPPPEFVNGVGANTTPHQQRYYRNKHSNCDLNQDFVDDGRNVDDAADVDNYYNQDSNGPVYEEILSNRNSDVQHYDVDDIGGGVHLTNDFDYNPRLLRQQQQQQQQQAFAVNGKNAINSRRNDNSNNDARLHRNIIGVAGDKATIKHDDEIDDDHDDVDDGDSICDDDNDDNDEDDDDDLDDQDNSSLHNLPLNSDERMRRLMALQDEDFKRRFRRQQRKNAAAAQRAAGVSSGGGGFYDYDTQPNTQAIHNGISGSGSVRSFKKTSPNSRVNEFFNHGPPLPPANAHPMQKRQAEQQQQQQQLSPQSTSASSSSASSSAVAPQKHATIAAAARNISAMLDENNTVRCYLEPLNK